MHSASLSIRGLAAALLVPGLALAHPEGHTAAGTLAGFFHPLTGIDHALAMIAVGLWAVQLGRTAIWLLPTMFPLAMIGGALLAGAAVPLPGIESMLALSVVAFGAAVALGVRLPLIATGLLVCLFAVFHGHAHFSEAPPTMAGIGYCAGFLAATVLLHGTGLAGGLVIARTSIQSQVLRVGGAVIASTGVCLLIL